jgi:hypothetical protein
MNSQIADIDGGNTDCCKTWLGSKSLPIVGSMQICDKSTAVGRHIFPNGQRRT